MNKKWTLLLLAAFLMLTACSKTDSSVNSGASSPGGKKTVVVAVMNSDPFLEKAAQAFEALHDDIHIEIKSHMASPDGDGRIALTLADMEKYIQSVTTQAIAGKATDLIAMGILPEDKFVEKKVLVNLNDLMEKDSSFDKKQYYGNVLKSSQIGDGLYVMPLSFSLGAVQGNVELLKKANITINDHNWTWNQFADITKRLKEQNGSDYLAFVGPGEILADYINENFSDLLKKGNPDFDSDTFRDALTQIKVMFSEKVIEGNYTETDKVLFSMKSMSNPKNVLLSALDPKLQYYQKPTMNGKSSGWKMGSFTTFGLNSKSKVQPEAWEFLKFMLSEEMQSAPELMGFPLSKAALDKKFADTEHALEQGELEVNFTIPDSETVKKQIQSLKTLLEGDGGEKSFSDQKVLDIVFEEFEPFITGQKSVEEVSKLIQNRVKTYLNE
ncbi:ABC transporter substrate-binding protein [Paenibacillus radicis (ex Gao et al. 2016)]|uniref:ABC transporter substrate-binding protein n=1 Tax=Paenibacillus radicis (ex Gao et al. 2016) TaxID=1737354 RepID=A0A917HQM2_9BACL|nr:extracellular solute-binding protein [Paenibacillus radicis (ex Gao et al. 2016)]GGG85888.1 ABC transporter substrate-binding protein [Paenibacillus radicis (ex Gao et al. 2016)]